jgi:hypothetical protein
MRALLISLAVVASSTGLNVAIFWLADRAGWISPDARVPVAEMPVTVGPIAMGTLAGTAAGMAVFALIAQLSPSPLRLFVPVALVALLLSFVTPVTVRGAPLSQILSMESMHVLSAGLVIAGAYWIHTST